MVAPAAQVMSSLPLTLTSADKRTEPTLSSASHASSSSSLPAKSIKEVDGYRRVAHRVAPNPAKFWANLGETWPNFDQKLAPELVAVVQICRCLAKIPRCSAAEF